MAQSLWFKGGKREQDVQVGSVFRHRINRNIVETAEVLEIAEDSLGIPHVTFEVKVEKAHFAGFNERRTLGLQSFYDLFHEPE